MRFGAEEAFWALAVFGPLFIITAFRVVVIIRNYSRFFDAKMGSKAFSMPSGVLAAIKYFALASALILFIIALARPQGRPIESQTYYSGIDIMILLDVSSSMWADDIKPNRMEPVKRGLVDFVYSLTGDRAGIITFAGINFVQCPLTNDYEAVELILDSIYPGMLHIGGTAIGDAISEGVARLEEEGEKSRIMILVSDGENTTGKPLLAAAKEAAEKGIRIYTIGVGTEQGGRIPEERDVFGRVRYKTHMGQVVVTKLDDKELRATASATGGKFFRVTDRNAFKRIVSDIQGMEANMTKSRKHTIFEENYAGYLVWALVFFLIYLLLPVGIPERIKNRFKF